MTRIARIVVPGLAHHVVQRGNRRQTTFFRPSDYSLYKELLTEQAMKWGVRLWTYCLIPNHIHSIAVPETPEGLARAFGEAHRRYTLYVNRREGWTGYLWQGRFASFPMDDAHLYAATRYILLNPVRAGLADRAIDWPHSSARSHLLATPDELIDPAGLASRISNWSELLSSRSNWAEGSCFRRHERTGRPLGDERFQSEIAERTGRDLWPDVVALNSKEAP